MLIVERATEDDLAGVLAIDASVETSHAAYLLEALRQRHLLIAREGEEHLGYAVVTRHFYGYPFIDLVVVRHEARRRGVAQALVSYIEKTQPGEKLFTSTNESNAPMHALMAKLGFVRSGWIDNLDEGDPEIIYFKRLER
jgi:GNAT superfamily N-acetyltransferase